DLKNEFCEISNSNFKIQIIAKPDNEVDETGQLKSKFNHVPRYNERVKRYDELPEYILNEFTKMTSGLVSNAALRSLSEIRKNSFKLINTFNSSIDPAFLAHRALLDNPEDSEEQIIDLIGSEIKAILKG